MASDRKCARRRAQRGAHGELVLPVCCPGDEQRRRVRAGDEQQQCHAAGRHEERRPDPPHRLFGDGNKPDTDVLVGRGTLGGRARRGRLELRRRLLEGCAVGEARQNRVVVADVIRPLPSVHVRREPQVAVLADRSWQGGARRHHADHGVRLVVHLNDAAQDVGIAAVPPSPQTVAENYSRRGVGGVFDWGEAAPDSWRKAEHRHDRRRDRIAANPFRVVVTRERGRAIRDETNRREGAQRVPVRVVPGCRLDLEDILLWQRLPDKDEPGGIAIGKRAQQDAVEQREYRTVDADSERQRQYDEEGECRPAQRVAPREHRVMNEHIELQGLTPDNRRLGARCGQLTAEHR
jgi:hypothetical protein